MEGDRTFRSSEIVNLLSISLHFKRINAAGGDKAQCL